MTMYLIFAPGLLERSPFWCYIMSMPPLENSLRWGLLKFRLLISPLGKVSILQNFILDSTNHIHIWHMLAVATSAKGERDILYTASILMNLKNWENNVTEENGLVNLTLVPPGCGPCVDNFGTLRHYECSHIIIVFLFPPSCRVIV